MVQQALEKLLAVEPKVELEPQVIQEELDVGEAGRQDKEVQTTLTKV